MWETGRWRRNEAARADRGPKRSEYQRGRKMAGIAGRTKDFLKAEFQPNSEKRQRNMVSPRVFEARAPAVGRLTLRLSTSTSRSNC